LASVGWAVVTPFHVLELHAREHADISMTINRSSHVTPDRQRSAADTLDAVFGKVS
jgi:hypothetical protein